MGRGGREGGFGFERIDFIEYLVVRIHHLIDNEHREKAHPGHFRRGIRLRGGRAEGELLHLQRRHRCLLGHQGLRGDGHRGGHPPRPPLLAPVPPLGHLRLRQRPQRYCSPHAGFQVFSKNCANCHGYMGKKYDLLLDKVYEQIELSTWVAEHFTIHPAHHHYKQFYYQEWDERDRYCPPHADTSTTTSTPPTSRRTRPRTPTEESGPLTSPRSE